MRKVLLKSVMAALVGVGWMAGNLMALPLDDGFEWVDDNYWTLTDFTSGSYGNTNFDLVFEDASWESSFGIYSVDDISNATLASVSTYEVFSMSEEPPTYEWPDITPPSTAVFFHYEGGTWYVASDVGENYTWTGTEQAFDSVFGFYFKTNTGYTWYSDESLNADESEHMRIAYNADALTAKIYLDDQWADGSDQDFNDMITTGDDLAPAPVPEPATMLLFGTGLAGIAGLRRRRKK